MIFPALHRGQDNSAVAGMKSGLRRALIANRIAPKALANSAYGDRTALDVRAFKKRYRLLPIDGTVWGSRAWNVLIDGGFLGEYDRERIRSHNRAVLAERLGRERDAAKAIHEVGSRARLAGVALRVYSERWRYTYRQTRPYSRALFSGGRYYDCSSMVTMMMREAGWPDPNGRDFDGWGFTGTLWIRGRATSSPKAGALAFYGNMGNGIPSHVAMHIDDDERWVVSFGSDPVKRLPVRYRSDFRGSRDYYEAA